MKRIRALLFDLDGTLLDSAPDLVASLNWVRRSEGLPEVGVEEVKRHASRGAIGLLEGAMPRSDPGTFEAWRHRFIDHYAQNSYRLSSLFEGVPSMLAALADFGLPWGVVTNKIESLTFPILEAAGLAGSAACVVCGDTLSRKKPDPAPVSLACEILGIDPRETLMVGDDVRDIQAGRAARTQTAAVLYGYGSVDLQGAVVEDSFPVHRPSDVIDIVARTHDGRDAD